MGTVAVALGVVLAGALIAWTLIRLRLAADRKRLRRAADEERRRIERDLHDGAQQRFVAAAMTLSATLAQARSDPNLREVEDALARAAAELRQGLAELRDLAHGIYPAELAVHGLAAAVESLVVGMAVPVEMEVEPERWPAAVEANAYFVICEALTNVSRHARASHARVRVTSAAAALVVEVEDDGVGGAVPRGLRDRVTGAGGTLEVTSPAGGGTVIRAVLPCE